MRALKIVSNDLSSQLLLQVALALNADPSAVLTLDNYVDPFLTLPSTPHELCRQCRLINFLNQTENQLLKLPFAGHWELKIVT